MKLIKANEREWQDRLTYKKQIVFDGKSLACNGAKFQIVKFLPNTSIEPHYHKKAVEIFYIKEGEATIKINGKPFRCKADDIMLVEPHDSHEIINDSGKDFVILIFKTNEAESDILWGSSPQEAECLRQ